MTLKELLKHFPNEIWTDLCTPIFRKCGELNNIKSELSDKILDMTINDWKVTNENILIIDM